MRTALGVLLVIGSVLGLAVLSGAPYTAEPDQSALIRLAWRARGERIRRCRRLSADELARLPAHMRQEEVCERGILPYQLRVTVDDSLVLDALIRAGGAERDRPLFVFHELPVTYGTHRLSIVFERQEPSGHKNDRNEEEDSAYRESHDLRATPRRLTLDDTVTLAPRTIVLVTYDDEGRRLRLLAGPQFDP